MSLGIQINVAINTIGIFVQLNIELIVLLIAIRLHQDAKKITISNKFNNFNIYVNAVTSV